MKKNKVDSLTILAYNNLVNNKNSDNILFLLADWICNMLNDDRKKILYFSLPIWNYLDNKWDSDYPNRISKDNDPVFPTKEEGWYEKEDGVELNTQFEQFVNKSGLEGGNNFSFVEFVTQNATNLNPIFTIRFDEAKKGDVNFKLIDKDTLSIINNRANCWKEEKYRTDFVNTTYKILVSEISQLNEVQRKDLESMYKFLCSYQSVWGKRIKCIYLITSRLFKEKTRDISSGGLILVCKEELDLFELSLLSMVVNLCYREKGGKNWEQKCRKEAIKSAKAAIMSRNMSHNIGSHVMSYLKQHLGSVKDIVTDGILADLIHGESELVKKLENTTENTTLPFLMGLGHFISYLQERQDFIATIATDYIPYFGNVNFKDAIYDELNPDKRALRHSDRKNGSTDNILLGNIARSEGLGRPTSPTQQDSKKAPLNDIVLKFRSRFDGSPVVELDDSGRIIATKDEDALKELDDMRKIDFSLPGGIVGRQAFFSIMENIIRNAAKHGNWRSMNNLELTFDVFSSKKEDIERLEKFNNDNVDEQSLTLKEVISNYYLDAIDSQDLYFVTITDNCTMVANRDGNQSWETLGKLRASLMSPYITDSGEMDGTNKGLKEIRISSAWLRAIHDESECFEPYDKETTAALLNDDMSKAWKKHNKDKKAPLIYVRISAEKGLLGLEASKLQYIICVQIPKKVALILKDDNHLQTIKNNLERINWRVYTKEDFVKERNKSFEFIIVDDLCDGYDDAFNEIRQCATARTFCLSDVKGLDRTEFFNRIKDEKYTGKEDLELLYKTLSQYKENEIIVVDDKVVFERGRRNNPSRDLSIGEGKGLIQIYDGFKGTNSVYIYRRHHEASREFTDFMKSRMNALFVEGITGNNSTDRLVRNETLNSLWFYRHLHAMKQRIAIFDERLFHKITGLEEKDLKANKAEKCKDNTALAYLQKGVYPFTLVEDDNDEGCYLLKGIIFDGNAPVIDVEEVKEDAQSPINTYHCKCDTLATIRLVEGKLEPKSTSYGEYMEKLFDFITIHQGLLDKLYEKFKIKDNVDAKKTVTKTLFEKYSRMEELNNGFIPNMIIHSGRSKPNKFEMPQIFPFIQYAALEHAVMDCKYSLVELLDFARYEE